MIQVPDISLKESILRVEKLEYDIRELIKQFHVEHGGAILVSNIELVYVHAFGDGATVPPIVNVTTRIRTFVQTNDGA